MLGFSTRAFRRGLRARCAQPKQGIKTGITCIRESLAAQKVFTETHSLDGMLAVKMRKRVIISLSTKIFSHGARYLLMFCFSHKYVMVHISQRERERERESKQLKLLLAHGTSVNSRDSDNSLLLSQAHATQASKVFWLNNSVWNTRQGR